MSNKTRWPLVGVDEDAPGGVLQGGYDFLDWTGDTWHPGIDLNTPGGPHTDLGAAIVAPVSMTTRYVGLWDGVTKGFGNHVWGQTPDGTWLHFCHLDKVLTRDVGHTVGAGSVFATCGRSGGWENEHCHFEVWKGPDAPPSWDFWPKGKSREWVAEHYHDAGKWLMIFARINPPQPSAQEQQDMERIAELEALVNDLNGQNTTRQEQIDALREELAARYGDIGALNTRIAELEAGGTGTVALNELQALRERVLAALNG